MAEGQNSGGCVSMTYSSRSLHTCERACRLQGSSKRGRHDALHCILQLLPLRTLPCCEGGSVTSQCRHTADKLLVLCGYERACPLAAARAAAARLCCLPHQLLSSMSRKGWWLSVMPLISSKRASMCRRMGFVSPCSMLSDCCATRGASDAQGGRGMGAGEAGARGRAGQQQRSGPAGRSVKGGPAEAPGCMCRQCVGARCDMNLGHHDHAPALCMPATVWPCMPCAGPAVGD